MAISNKDIGGEVKCVSAHAPVAYDGTDADGTEIDRQGYHSGVLYAETSGGSAGDVVQYTFEHSDETGAGYVAWTDAPTVPELNEAADSVEVDIDYTSAKRFVRVTLASADQTVATTVNLAASMCLGGADDVPA